MKKKTKPELRVEIAKDVLKHIKANSFIPEAMTYFEVKSKHKYVGRQLKDILPKIKECRVCAIGGMFYSYVMRHNNYEIDVDGVRCVDPDENRKLMSMFTTKQLELIEGAFEMSGFVSKGDYSRKTIDRARNYRERLNLCKGVKGNDEKALIHIMKNIIKNKGTFKP